MNAVRVGRSYPPVSFVVDAERVSAFARAVGHPGGGVPPTLVTAPELASGLDNVLADPDLGLDLARVLHSEQEYAWERTLTEGETVTAETWIEDARSKGGLGFLVLRTEVRDVAGATIVVGRTTIVVRGSA